MKLYDKRKVLLLFLAVCIAFWVLSAETLIAREHDHICTGKHCHICLQIEIVKCFLRTITLAGIIFLFSAFHELIERLFRINKKFIFYTLTPVGLKVRFNS